MTHRPATSRRPFRTARMSVVATLGGSLIFGACHGGQTPVAPEQTRTQEAGGNGPAALGGGWALKMPGAGEATADKPADSMLVTAYGGLHAFVGVTNAVAPGVVPTLADAAHYVVTAAIPDNALPPQAAALLGERLDVLTGDGSRCAAEVVGFDYRVELIPDGDFLDQHGSRAEGVRSPAADAALAQAIWDSTLSKSLAARLAVHDPEHCSGTPIAAYDSDVPARLARPQEMPSATRIAALDAFFALPEYAAQQAAYRQETAQNPEGAWPTRWEDDGHALVVQAFPFDGPAETLVSISAPQAGCRGFDQALWAVFQLEADGTLTAVHTSTDISAYGVSAIIDTGDGGFEYVIDEGLGSVTLMRGQQRLASWVTEFHGCPC